MQIIYLCSALSDNLHSMANSDVVWRYNFIWDWSLQWHIKNMRNSYQDMFSHWPKRLPQEPCYLQPLKFPMAAYDVQQYVVHEHDEINQVWIAKPHSDRKSTSADILLTEMQQFTLTARYTLNRYQSTEAKQSPLEHNSSMQKLNISMLIMSLCHTHPWKYRLPKYGDNYKTRTYCRIL